MSVNHHTKKENEDIQTIVSKKHTLLSDISPAKRLSLLSCLLIAFMFGATQFVLMNKSYGFFSLLIAGVVNLVFMLLVVALLTLLLSVLTRIHWLTSFVFLTSLFLCKTLALLAFYVLPFLVFCTFAAYFAVMFVTGRYKAVSKPKKIMRYGLLGLFSVLALSILALTFSPGPALTEIDRPGKATLALPYAERIGATSVPLDDPSLPGGHKYSVYYYASPGQKLPPYPGQKTISTQPVDAAGFLEGWSPVRKLQLGLGSDELPLNAQVWMPNGNGPFPLTLIVHGNHEAGERSDNGYAYLGELLASRGIIAVSVDENFLNNSELYDVPLLGSIQNENTARASILLDHLRQWYAWNNDASSQFFRKVDFDNLAFIGHSRGGEAVAIAAEFSQLNHYPDNGMIGFQYPFKIKTVVAIAPTNDMYVPAGLELNLKNINYLVLQGVMDSNPFAGANMYRRADVSDSGIKAQIWMQYANHGQFNSSWGENDGAGLANLLFNRKLLMPMTEQQQAAKVFISAFLEATLHGKHEYSALFKDFAHGAQWLPAAKYITDYTDSHTVLLDSYDTGFDLSASSSGKVSYSAQGFESWTKASLPGRAANSNRILTLSRSNEKSTGQMPIFKMMFQKGTISAGDKLYISLCSGKLNPNEADVSFKIKLTDSAGNTALMSANDFGGVVNPMDAPITKPPFAALLGSSEPVLQAVCIPTERFKGLKGDIVSMEWIFEKANGQVLYADDLRVEKE